MSNKKIEAPYGIWCIVSVPGYCKSGMRIAIIYTDNRWTDDEGVDITKWVKDYKLATTFFIN